jgi:hypothetical protein
LSRVDEAVLTEALRREFPETVYLDREAWEGSDVPICNSLVECTEHRQIRIFAPDPSEPAWEPHSKPSLWPGLSWLANPPERNLWFIPSKWDWGPRYIQAKWAWDPPTLSEGWIWGGFWPEEKNQIAFIRRVWRIIERIATNRCKAGHPVGNAMMNSDRILTSQVKGCFDWIGHHALEWSHDGGPRRMLDGKFRPCDDWMPPQDEWYQSLRREVIDRYGAELGRPPSEPPY